jgi:hypothetical protein
MASLPEPSNLIRNAKLIAVPIPFILGGYSLSFSQNVIPAIHDHNAAFSTPAFAQVFYAGAKVIPAGSALATAATAYLAYAVPAQRNLWGAATAAMLFPAFVFTPAVMLGNINRLIEISGSEEKQGKATVTLEARQRLLKWGRQNYVRALVYFVAGALAVRATLV